MGAMPCPIMDEFACIILLGCMGFIEGVFGELNTSNKSLLAEEVLGTEVGAIGFATIGAVGLGSVEELAEGVEAICEKSAKPFEGLLKKTL